MITESFSQSSLNEQLVETEDWVALNDSFQCRLDSIHSEVSL
jgi:hypothetical protein